LEAPLEQTSIGVQFDAIQVLAISIFRKDGWNQVQGRRNDSSARPLALLAFALGFGLGLARHDGSSSSTSASVAEGEQLTQLLLLDF